VLAAAVVGDIRKAICKTDAQVVYVANLRAEVAEARGHDLAAHVAALVRHGITPDVVLAHPGALPAGDLGGLDVEVVEADVARAHGLSHDPAKLGPALAALLG
jgi:hypothetical protein